MSGGAPAELTREDREELVALGHSYAFAADGRARTIESMNAVRFSSSFSRRQRSRWFI